MRAIELYETNVEASFELFPKFKSYEEIGEFIMQIQAECSDFISNNGGRWLYRATDDVDNQIAIATPTPGRKPVSTPTRIHNKAVKWMSEHGAKANRDNAFFCYNNIYDTQGFENIYGNRVYAVLPMNGYHYTWFEDVFDFTMQGPGTIINIDNMDQFASKYPMHVDEGMSQALVGHKDAVEVLVLGRCYFIQASIFDDMFRDNFV